MLLCRQQVRIVSERLQDVGNLAESLQHRLLVICGGRLEQRQRCPPFGLSGATIEDRLGEPRGDAPYEARGIEQISPVQPRDPDSPAANIPGATSVGCAAAF
jgi:hypothetical protein